MAWVPPGIEVNNPPHWSIAKDEVHHVGDPVALVIGEDRYAVVDAAEQVLVEYDPLPVVTDIETALEDGADLVHADLGTNKCHEWSLGGGDLEAGFAAADVIVERRVVNHRTAGAAIEPRGVLADYRVGLADAHVLDAGAALPAAVPGAPARDQRGAGPGDRARGRRRLRLQAADLRRGDLARVGVAQARAADQVDRGPLGGHADDPSRARPDRVRADRRHPRREDHRLPREDPPGPRRLPDAADADDPVARRVRDERRLRHPGGPDRHRRRVHEQDADGRHPRRRPARGDAHDRGVRRPARGRAGDGPDRAAPEELHGSGELPARDRARRRLRLRRLPRGARQAVRALRRGRREGRGARGQAARRRLLDLHGDLRPGAVARRRARRASACRPACGSRRWCACTSPAR